MGRRAATRRLRVVAAKCATGASGSAVAACTRACAVATRAVIARLNFSCNYIHINRASGFRRGLSGLRISWE